LGEVLDLPLENTPIRRVRSGVREGNDLRLVFDLDAAVKPKSFALQPNERTGHRLVIDLYDLDGAAEQRETIKVLNSCLIVGMSLSPLMQDMVARIRVRSVRGSCERKRSCWRLPESSKRGLRRSPASVPS
jgi:hypothetical protein